MAETNDVDRTALVRKVDGDDDSCVLVLRCTLVAGGREEELDESPRRGMNMSSVGVTLVPKDDRS